MNYELAKKLKDAGFPQHEYLMAHEAGSHDFDRVAYHLVMDEPELVEVLGSENCKKRQAACYTLEYLNSEQGKKLTVYIPTLSELIEACGKWFDSLEYAKKGTEVPSNTEWLERDGRWVAVASDADGITIEDKAGHTPEEAVSKLWLALNA